MLDGLKEIKVCVGYELDGKRIERFGCPVALLSISPEHEDTILMTDPFRD